MFSVFAARLASRSVLRFSATTSTLLRPGVVSTLSRASLSQAPRARTFLTTARLEFPEAKKSSTTKKPKAKASAAKKKPAKKTAAKKVVKKVVKKVAAKRVAKKAAKKAKPAKRTFDRKLMTPPKRPISGFIIFSMEQLAKAGPKDMAGAQAANKESGELWKKLPDSDKQAYIRRHTEAHAKWLQDYAEWYNNLPPGYFREINRRRKAKSKTRYHYPKVFPKKPKSAWIYFLMDYRQAGNHQGGPATEISTAAAAEWKAMSDAQKEKYHRAAREEREEYLKNQQKQQD